MTPDERERPGRGALADDDGISLADDGPELVGHFRPPPDTEPRLVCEVWATRSAELGTLSAVWTEISDRLARQEATAQARATLVREAIARVNYLAEHGRPAPTFRPSRRQPSARLAKGWSKRAEGMGSKLRRAKPGNRNALLYWCARTLTEEGAPDEVIDALAEAAQTAGLSEREVRQVVTSVRRGRP
jgi:hypothetical protein